jgi:hypothetical protein
MKKIILTSALFLGGIATYAQSTVKFSSQLANTIGKTITKESIMAEPVLLSSPTPSAVSSFSIYFQPAGKENPIKRYAIKGNKLSEETISIIKGLHRGDRIVIEDVKVSSGREYDAEGVQYTIEK